MTIHRIGLAVWLTALTAGGLVLAQEGTNTIQVSGAAGGSPVHLKLDNPLLPESRTISVTGTGKISAAPDVADISVGVVSQAASAREALNANNEAMEALLKTVAERGVASKDVQTSNISIVPQYTQPQIQPGQPRQPQDFESRIYAYQVSNTATITVRDLSKIGSLLDAIVSAGANRMNGISFRIEQSKALLDQCRKEAMADAKDKAELIAGEAGVVLGPPISIVEQGATMPPPRPMMMARGGMMAMDAAVPIASGEEELSTTVQVVYELRLPK